MILDEFTPLRMEYPSAWFGHIPFGIWVGRALAPQVFVELGAHHGHSFFNISMGVFSQNPQATCMAVDTWEGDVQAGTYGEDVFEGVKQCNASQFNGRCRLLRCTFDEARDHVEDGSIDLLHIDGCHHYTEAKHDFEHWLPKMSTDGVILFHDICEMGEGYGVWQLWRELKKNYPVTFEFTHSSGLGILCLGEEVPEGLDSLNVGAGSMMELFRCQGMVVIERHLQHATHQHMGADQQRLQQQLDRLQSDYQAERGALIQKVEEEETQLRDQLKTLSSQHEHLHSQLRQSTAVRNLLLDYMASLFTGVPNQNCRELSAWLSRHKGVARLLTKQWLFRYTLRNRSFDLTRTYRMIEASGHFKSGYYVAQNPDVLFQGAEPLLHWVSSGCEEGRRPHPCFDPHWYLTTYPDVRESGMNPFVHYINTGATEGRRPSGEFEHLFVATDDQEGRSPGLGLEPFLKGLAAANDFVPERSFDPQLNSLEAVETLSNPFVHDRSHLHILIVSGSPESAGHQYRVRQLEGALLALNHRVRLFDMHQAYAPDQDFETFDVVVFWRIPCCPQFERVVTQAKAGGAKIVCDMDDLIFAPEIAKAEVIDGIRSQAYEEEDIQKLFLDYQQAMLLCDVFFCPTESLAKHMLRLGRTTHVIHNGYTANYLQRARIGLRESNTLKRSGLIRIGYASGSLTHQKDFEQTVSACVKILKKYAHSRLVLFVKSDEEEGIKLTLDLAEFPELQALEHQIELRPFVSFDLMPYELARFDINLAPLEVGNLFCEAKSELKYFEAALVKVPTVASPTLPFKQSITSGKNGFLAETEAEWFDALDLLVKDEAARKSMGRQAYIHALWKFGPERKVEVLRDTFGQIIGGGEEASRNFNSISSVYRHPPAEVVIPEHVLLFTSSQGTPALVSVVIPLYDCAEYLVDALESVRTQTLTDIELIVVDDASTDESAAVAKAWLETHASRFCRVLLLQNTENVHVGLSRNLGFVYADSDYVFPLDAGDKLLPTCLERCVHSLKDSDAAMCYPLIQHLGSSTHMMGEQAWSPTLLAFNNYIDGMALIKTSAWAQVGGYRPMFGWEDYDLWCKFLETGFWGQQVDEVLGHARVHEASMLKTFTMQPETHQEWVDVFRSEHPWVKF
ncbi:glycosyltransferase [Kiritimatiellota bacterium B12222]|nr:glycosyltransferase [Kiritimatiellota bacterium B12222]